MSSSLSEEDKQSLATLVADLADLFKPDKIVSSEIDSVQNNLKTREAKDYLGYLKTGSKPEFSLREAFFAGNSLLSRSLADEISPETTAGEGIIDYRIVSGGRVVLLELKSLFEASPSLEGLSLHQKKLQPENHKDQILKYVIGSEYSRTRAEYVILTNLKTWLFYNKNTSSTRFTAFKEADLTEFYEDLIAAPNLYECLSRYDMETSLEGLDKIFFESLALWVKEFEEVKFNVGDRIKLELVVRMINRFLFVQTLSDLGVINYFWIKDRWDETIGLWERKGEKKVLEEFFHYVTHWVHENYDTELFRDDLLPFLEQSEVNIKLFHEKVKRVLGITYYISPFAIYRGILQYNFRFINEDIFGKAYETFLAEIRKEQGIYYTPAYVSLYIAQKSLGEKLEKISADLESALQTKNPRMIRKTVDQLIKIKILDPACGSGSFLIKAFKLMYNAYLEYDSLLDKAKAKSEMVRGNLDQSEENLPYFEALTATQDALGASNRRRMISRILLRHIYGNDLDPKALEVAKVNLWLEAIKLSPESFKYKSLPKDEDHVLPDLELNLEHGDSLFSLQLPEVLSMLAKHHQKDLVQMSNARNGYIENPNEPDFLKAALDMKATLAGQLGKKLNEQYNSYWLKQHGKASASQAPSTPFPIFWPLEFWFAYYDDKGQLFDEVERGFDVVIGNPPYFTEVRGYKQNFRLYSSSPLVWKYYEAKMDVFYFFIEIGLDLLKPKGVLAFIVMQYWSSRGSGKTLRNKIATETVLFRIVNFGEFKVFEDAKGQHNSIIFLKKSTEIPKSYEVPAIEVVSSDTKRDEVTSALIDSKFGNNVIQNSLVFAYNTDLKKIILLQSNLRKIVEKIEVKSNYRIPNSAISQGLVLPQDKVRKDHLEDHQQFKEGDGIFLLSDTEVLSMSLNPDERALIQPFFQGRQIDSFYYEDHPVGSLIYAQKKYLDFDQTDVNKISKQTGQDSQIVEADILEKVHQRFPSITAHLDRFQELITSDRKPYGLHRSRTAGVFLNRDKIVSARKTYYPKFVWITRPYFMDESANFIDHDPRIDSRYFVAILNSALMWFWFRFGAQKIHGTQLQIDIEILENVPLLLPMNKEIETNLVALSDQAFNLKKARHAYLEMWKRNSKSMAKETQSLTKILETDLEETRSGSFDYRWTTNVSFYPDEPGEEWETRYAYFEVENEVSQKEIRIYGSDDEGGLPLIFTMRFSSVDLMTHVYSAFLSGDLTQAMTLKDLFDCKIPEVTPNPAKNTGNIIRKVNEDFSAYLISEKLLVPKTLDQLEYGLIQTLGKIDAAVFERYGLNRAEILVVLKHLGLGSKRKLAILDAFDKLQNPR